MEILGFTIPNEVSNKPFLDSLIRYYQKHRKLTPRQYNAFLDLIGVELDFFDYEYQEPEESHYYEDYINLREKLKRNRFIKVSGKNKVVRALNSIIEGKPDINTIDEALDRRKYYK